MYAHHDVVVFVDDDAHHDVDVHHDDVDFGVLVDHVVAVVVVDDDDEEVYEEESLQVHDYEEEVPSPLQCYQQQQKWAH